MAVLYTSPTDAPAQQRSWFTQQGVPLPPPAAAQPAAAAAPAPTTPAAAAPAAPGATAPTGAGSSAQPTIDDVLAIMSQFPANNEGFRAGVAAVKQRYPSANFDLLEHDKRLDKVSLNGQVYDLVTAATGTSGSWVSRATPEAPGGHGAAAGGVGAGGNWQAGMDPSYGFRFGEGLKALERSAAAKGTLLTGGTLKALTRYGQDAASQEFGNIFNRNYQLANLGFNAASNAANLGSAYGSQVGNLASNTGSQLANLSDAELRSLNQWFADQGNVQAGGTTGQAGQWQGALSKITDMFGAELARRQNPPLQNPR